MITETQRTIYTQENLMRDVTRLAESMRDKGYKGVFPLNKGGHIIAGYLSGETGLPVNTCGCHMSSNDLYVADSIRTKEELEEIKWKLRLNPEKPTIEDFILPVFGETITLPFAIPVSLVASLFGNKKQIIYTLTREALEKRKNPPIPGAQWFRIAMLHETNGFSLPTTNIEYLNERVEPGQIVYPWDGLRDQDQTMKEGNRK